MLLAELIRIFSFMWHDYVQVIACELYIKIC